MSEATFNPACSQIYAIEAANNMMFALINEETQVAGSMNVASERLQEMGQDQLVAMKNIYSGEGTYTLEYMTIGFTGENDSLVVNVKIYTYSDPGWGSTDDNDETQAVTQVASQYYEMIQNGYQSFDQMGSSEEQQSSQNSMAMSSFASDQSGNNTYAANLLASG